MDIRLHKTQLEFTRSQALYRAFCAGVGSGKSWVGSYDLIKRSKPDRLYMVIAPTFSMLHDSTLRSFKEVTDVLGIAVPEDFKSSPSPSVKLANKAEIIFRSGDDAERLRGPNLSGIWLDEASQMEIGVFNISIGRLRQAGELGWLSATYTPRGRGHWTYETFATGKPDTEHFSCPTGANPFLHAKFEQSVRQQYTEVFAQQELGGVYTDTAGLLFNRNWFEIVEEAPSNLKIVVRAWDLAATPKNQDEANDPDYTAGVKGGRAEDGTNYIMDVRVMRGTPQQVQSLVKNTATHDGKAVQIWMEQEPGASGVTVIDHYMRHVLFGYDFHGERSTGHKPDRARPLAAQAEAGTVKVVRGEWNKRFLDEIEGFPFGEHDDIVDSCSLMFSKLQPKKKLWIG